MADQSSDPTSGGEEIAIIKRILKEEKFKLEEVFVEMLRVMGERHVLCEQRKKGMAKAITPKQVQALGPERLDPILATCAPLAEGQLVRSSIPGANDTEQANLQRTIQRILFDCQILAERRAGWSDDDDDDAPPIMRLVRD